VWNYAATQLDLQLHQECKQVVQSGLHSEGSPESPDQTEGKDFFSTRQHFFFAR